jgi:hypothetical protein
MAKVKLQYPVSVCYHKRWFSVEDVLCVLVPQTSNCCVPALIGYPRNLATAICFTVVGFLGKTVLHYFCGGTSRFLASLIYFSSGQQKPKQNGEPHYAFTKPLISQGNYP